VSVWSLVLGMGRRKLNKALLRRRGCVVRMYERGGEMGISRKRWVYLVLWCFREF
jgi:hypothetical protein